MRIFLIRHGYSEGNQDPENYITRGDPHIRLTDTGWDQAIAAGKFLKDYLADNPGPQDQSPRLWMSSYARTRETAAGVVHAADGAIAPNQCRVSPHLIEQDFGMFAQIQGESRREHYPLETAFYKAARARDSYYARPMHGESPMDVQSRVAPLIGTLMRDRERNGAEDHILVAHGVSLRAFAMAFLKIDPAQYQNFKNPQNASIYLIEGDTQKGYSLHQIYNGKNMKPVKIDWGKKLGLGTSHLPPVPERFRTPPSSTSAPHKPQP